MDKVTLFKFGEVAKVTLPFDVEEILFNRTLLTINGELFVKTAQARTPERELILLVRQVLELPGIMEGVAAVEGERLDAERHGAGWLDKRDCPLQVVWESCKNEH